MTILPWDDIPIPDIHSLYNYRLADLDHPFEFFWARDKRGGYVFRFKGRYPIERTEDAPNMSGISASGEEMEGWSYFNLALEGTENAELFLTLCRSLMSATEAVEPENHAAAIDIILTRLNRWQSLLKARNDGLLSLDRQIGLFGELLVLRDIFIANLEPLQAVSCWNGPLGDEQDFGYANSLVEVKTTRSTRDQSFKVSSFPQLDTRSGNITLAFQTVGVFEDDPPNGVSLNGIVDSVRSALCGHSAATSELDVRLSLSGYSSAPAYDRIHFVAASRKLFSVVDDFPRIEPSDVRNGILKGTYTVSIDSCLRFELEPDLAIARILKGVEAPHLDTLEVPPAELVELDESSELEFKSSVRWSYQEQKVNPALELVIIKTVSALANSKGGHLVIGVGDEKEILGLEQDYKTLKKSDKDGFEQHLYQLLLKAFGSPFCVSNVSVSFPIIQNREICVLKIKRSKALLAVEQSDKSGNKRQAYFVRTGNSSRELQVGEIIAHNELR
jgi:hypothetical protein